MTTLAARLARLDRAVTPEQRRELSDVTGGPTLSELSAALLRAVDQDVIEATAKALARPTSAPADAWSPEPTSEQIGAARKALVGQACAPFENPAVRDALSDVKRETEQTIDEVTLDTVVGQGFDAAATEKATSLLRSFRDYIEANKAEISALQILYSRPYRQRLTEPLLKELEKKLSDNHAAWTEDRLWEAFKTAAPQKVSGRSQAGRFADLVALVGFALEQQPVLEPFAESVRRRFDSWLTQKAAVGIVFSQDQLTWLELIRDHIATSLSIEPEDFGYAPFNQRGGLGKAHNLFGADLAKLLDELNEALAA